MPLAPLLLIYVGALTGLNPILGKLAAEAGVSPFVWAALVSLGASAPLVPWLLWRGRLRFPTGATLRYVIVAGAISFVAANLVLFALLPRVGAGQMGLMYALSPVFTLGFSALFGLRVPGWRGLAGILFGLSGAILISVARGAEVGGIGWALAGLAMPILLAVGNVYRTVDWPEGADPAALAVWSHATAVVVFTVIILFSGVALIPVLDVPAVSIAQILASAITFPAFFLLQRLGGPVVLSQLGYVAAATGLLLAVVFLQERFDGWAWTGAGLIVIGVLFTTADQRKLRLAAPTPRATKAA